MENYKGIYYKEEKEQKLYEGGAHFKYNKLYKILLSLGGIIEDDDFNHSISKYKKKEHIKSNKDISSLLIKVRAKKSKYKTRNLVALIYDNNPNPNTQIKHDNKKLNNTKNTSSFKDFSRNNNKGHLMNKKYSYYKKAITSVSINNLHKNKNRINNDLINIILRKKEIDNKIHDKSNNTNNNHLSLFNYSRYIHNRNRSDSFSNINNSSTFNHNISHTQRFENGDKIFMKSIDNKIIVNKKKNFNTLNTNDNDKEVNEKEKNNKNENDKKKNKNKN